MLIRQKVILRILVDAGRRLDRISFVKLVFLMRQETPFSEDHTFYDFVPYKAGPFSFALYRELDALIHDGYVVADDDGLRVNPETRPLTIGKVRELPDAASSSVTRVLSGYGKKDRNALLKYVYEKYPWYASASEFTNLIPAGARRARAAKPAVYTIGYEGRSVDGFFNVLLTHGMSTVIDVRANPVSRKYGFAGTSLKGIAQKLGLNYTHFPTLGIPSGERTDLHDFESYQRLLDRYVKVMLPQRTDDVLRLAAMLQEQPSVLLCAERDVRCCHRGRLANAVSSVVGLPVVHI